MTTFCIAFYESDLSTVGLFGPVFPTNCSEDTISYGKPRPDLKAASKQRFGVDHVLQNRMFLGCDTNGKTVRPGYKQF
jgi:hypothetical protein